MKRDMKTLLTLLLVVIVTFSYSRTEAQNEGFDLNQLSATPTVGFLNTWGDFSTNAAFSDFTSSEQNKLGYGLRINYDVLDFLRISGGVLAGTLRGSDDIIKATGAIGTPLGLGAGIYHETNVFEVILPRADVNLSQLIFKGKSEFFNDFAVRVHGGLGITFFNAKIYSLNSPEVSLIYSEDRGDSGNQSVLTTSYGLDLAYRIHDQFDINLGTSLRNVQSDELDAWGSNGSANDKLSYTSLGFSYYFDKR